MAPKPSNILIGLLIILTVVGVFISIYADTVSKYSLTQSGFDYTVYNKLNETSIVANSLNAQFDQNAQVSSTSTVTTFINSGFGLLQLIGRVTPTANSIISNFANILNIDPLWVGLFSAAFIVFFIAMVVTVMLRWPF